MRRHEEEHRRFHGAHRGKRGGHDPNAAHFVNGAPREDEGDHHEPADGGEEAVGIRHVIQIERQRPSKGPRDPRFFHAQEDQHRPHHIDELHGHKKQP